MSPERPFARETFHALLELVQARTPTPGGGTVAALAGALGASLGCMAVRFTSNRKEVPIEQRAVLESVERGLVELAARLETLADQDAEAFEQLRAARKLPQATAAEKEARAASVRRATDRSAEVPLQTARLCRDALELLDGVTSALHRNLATDVCSGAHLLLAGARSAGLNVRVNYVGDETPIASAARAELEGLLARAGELARRLEKWCEGQLASTG